MPRMTPEELAEHCRKVGILGGRPTKYRPEYCRRVIELGLQGYCHSEWARDLGVDKKTLMAWTREFPEFKEAFDHASDYHQAHWEGMAHDGVYMGKDFNAQLWSRSMACRFPREYREDRKVELTGPNGGPLATVAITTDDPQEAARAYQELIKG